MRLTYWLITRNIVRCHLDTIAEVHHGPHMRYQEPRDGGVEWNMSATIARQMTISAGDGSAVIEWRDSGLVQVSGDLAVEINRLEKDATACRDTRQP